VCRNPLAEPGLLGVTSGAGLGAVTVLLLVPGVGIWPMSAAALAGAFLVTSLVFALAHRGGLSSTRLVLIGVGMQAGVLALITLLIVVTRPWDVNLALTWLAGSTYGRTLEQLLPVTVALLLITPLAAALRRELDLVALDEDTPRLLGVPLDRTRLLLLAAAALLTASSPSSVWSPRTPPAPWSAPGTPGSSRWRCCWAPSWSRAPTPSGGGSSPRSRSRPASAPRCSAPRTSSTCCGEAAAAQPDVRTHP
jgi:hypothetical protein